MVFTKAVYQNNIHGLSNNERMAAAKRRIVN